MLPFKAVLEGFDFDPDTYRLVHEISAGGVVLIGGAKSPKVVVIEREAMDDVSLPKGHIEVGESAQEAAVREVEEETGFAAKPTAYLGNFTYQVKSDKTKTITLRTVHWFLMKAQARKPRKSNEEVRKIRLEPLKSDFSFLTYDNDRMFIKRAKEVLKSLPATGGNRHSQC